MDRPTLKKLGEKCKRYRLSIGCRQADVAKETGYSIENVSSFERGRNDNLMILLWYIEKGMPLDDFLEC